MNKFYAGIGSRKMTNQHMYSLIPNVSYYLEDCGYILRSGGAEGSDSLFYDGLKDKTNSEIYLPWKNYNKSVVNPLFKFSNEIEEKSELIAGNHHPAWSSCNGSVRKLHSRNALIILGKDINIPCKFVVCYTENEEYGGTSLGLRIAKTYNIPVFNLAKIQTLIRFKEEIKHIINE